MSRATQAQRQSRLVQEHRDRTITKLGQPAAAIFLIVFAVVAVCTYKELGWFGRHGRAVLGLLMIVGIVLLSIATRAAAGKRYYRP